MTIAAQAVDEMRERFCAKCSRVAGCPILARAQSGVRPSEWVHPRRRAVVLVCRGFMSDGQPKEEAPAPQLEMFDVEPEPYRHVRIGAAWDDYDAAAFGRRCRDLAAAIRTAAS